jgi:hypothetical protein
MSERNDHLNWRRPCGNGACVEVAFGSDTVRVRDSKDPSGPRLTFTFEEWAAFLAGVRTTVDYDLPSDSEQVESLRDS